MLSKKRDAQIEAVKTASHVLSELVSVSERQEELQIEKNSLRHERDEINQRKAKLSRDMFAAKSEMDSKLQAELRAAALLAQGLDDAINGTKDPSGKITVKGFRQNKDDQPEQAFKLLQQSILSVEQTLSKEVYLEAISDILKSVRSNLANSDINLDLMTNLQQDLRRAQMLLEAQRNKRQEASEAIEKTPEFQERFQKEKKELDDLEEKYIERLDNSRSTHSYMTELARKTIIALNTLVKTGQPLTVDIISDEDLLTIFKKAPDRDLVIFLLDNPIVRDRITGNQKFANYYATLIKPGEQVKPEKQIKPGKEEESGKDEVKDDNPNKIFYDDPKTMQSISKLEPMVSKNSAEAKFHQDLAATNKSIEALRKYINKRDDQEETPQRGMLGKALDHVKNFGSENIVRKRQSELKKLTTNLENFSNLIDRYHDLKGQITVLEAQNNQDKLPELIEKKQAKEEELRSLIATNLKVIREAIMTTTEMENVLKKEIKAIKDEITTFTEQMASSGLDYKEWLQNDNYKKRPGDKNFNAWDEKLKQMRSDQEKLENRLKQQIEEEKTA